MFFLKNKIYVLFVYKTLVLFKIPVKIIKKIKCFTSIKKTEQLIIKTPHFPLDVTDSDSFEIRGELFM